MGKQNQQSSDTKEIALQATVMALREECMGYFKGNCVDRLTTNRNLSVVPLSQYAETRMSYQRRELENTNPVLIAIGGVPIMTLKQAPDRVIFHTKALNRSPQLRYIYAELEEFFKMYLPAVTKQQNEEAVKYAAGD